MKQAVSWIGFVVGAGALIIQLGLTIPLRLNAGDDLFGALVFYLSFFTILTNLMLVAIYGSELWPWRWLGWFHQPVTRAMMVAAIALVMAFYHYVLAETWDPQGLGLVCDVVLHYATPTLYLLWWLLFQRHGALRWADIPTMLLPPTIYLVYAMVRGAAVGEYPYPILDADSIGYGLVAFNVLVVLVGLGALCVLAAGVDRLLSRSRLLS